MAEFNFTSVGTVHSCYKEKFGIPRQPGLVMAPASIEIIAEYAKDEAFRELESFSHIWVTFVFHAIESKSWKATVRPPRLGGNQRVGVFASRSMFRPNPIGLSVVELKSIERINGKIILNIVGGDFLDGTPVLDIKPYLSYVDSVTTSESGYAAEAPDKKLDVAFSDDAMDVINNHVSDYINLKNTIAAVLQQDPRPAYQHNKNIKNTFSIKLFDFDVKWSIDDNEVFVTEIIRLN